MVKTDKGRVMTAIPVRIIEREVLFSAKIN